MKIKVFFLLTVLVIIACYPIFSLGFLSDEWLQLGDVRSFGIFTGYIGKLPVLDILMGKGRFLGGMINNAFFYYFGSNPMPFALFAVVFHLINSYLVYLVTKEITGKKSTAFIIACIFSVPAAAHQTISWLAASVQTTGGMTFVLLAILIAIRGIKTNNTVDRVLSWVFAYTAFLFKESSFFIFPLLLGIPYIVPTRKKITLKRTVFFWFIPFILVGALKIVQLFGPDTVGAVGKVLVNIVLYPLITLSQFFIPFRFMLRFALWFAGYFYSFLLGAGEANRAASVVVADLLSIIFSFLIILAIAYLYEKRKEFRRLIQFAACWYVLSFVPMAVFLPERNTAYLESRYLYFPFFPVSLIVGFMTVEIQVFVNGIIRNAKVAWGITLLLFSLFLYKQITLVHREIRQNTAYANETGYAMNALRQLYPTLPDRPVFLVEGDRTFYYAKIYLPFQEGAGFMLELTFKDYPSISKELLGTKFLRKPESEGYQEVGNKGFGYFVSRDDLLTYLRAHPAIATDQIVAMYYYGFEGRLTDTTAAVREYILRNR